MDHLLAQILEALALYSRNSEYLQQAVRDEFLYIKGGYTDQQPCEQQYDDVCGCHGCPGTCMLPLNHPGKHLYFIEWGDEDLYNSALQAAATTASNMLRASRGLITKPEESRS